MACYVGLPEPAMVEHINLLRWNPQEAESSVECKMTAGRSQWNRDLPGRHAALRI